MKQPNYPRFTWLCLLMAWAGVSSLHAQTTEAFIQKLENSNAYAQNITLIEKELGNKTLSADEQLQLRLLLLNNYNYVNEFEKSAVFCQRWILEAKQKGLTYDEASLYLALGRIYYRLKQNDKMLQYNLECLKLASKHQYYILLKKCYHNLGVMTLETDNNLAQAESYFLKAIEFGKKTNFTRKDNIAGNYRLLATTYDLEGRYRQADSVFRLSAALYRKFDDTLGMIEALTFHARLFKSQKQFDKALPLVNEAVALAEGMHNSEYIQTALSMHSQIMDDMGNYRAAGESLKRILQLEIERNAGTLKTRIAESEARFKVAELKSKQEVLELQARQSKQVYIFVFLIILLVVIAALAVLYQKRLAQKEQELKLRSLREVHEAEEKERSRIAKDLHDNMGAYATSILAQIDQVELSPQNEKDEKIQALRTDAENIMSTLRETIWILKAKNLTARQFFEMIKLYGDKQLVKSMGLNVTYHEEISSDKPLGPSTSLNLYRIVQEVIQNITKHARARSVDIHLTSGKHLALVIKDDGAGFDSVSGSRSGLGNMAYRAAEIGFTLQVSSVPGKGTTVTVEEKL